MWHEHLSTSEKVKSISNDEKVTSVHTIKMKKEHGGYLRHHQRVDPQSYEHLHISALTHKAKSLQHPQSNTSSMLKFIWSLCISKSSQKLTSSWRLIFDLSTKECRTFRTHSTFHTLFCAWSFSSSSGVFFWTRARNCAKDWNWYTNSSTSSHNHWSGNSNGTGWSASK